MRSECYGVGCAGDIPRLAIPYTVLGVVRVGCTAFARHVGGVPPFASLLSPIGLMPSYTPEQATATLPLVRRIVEDLVQAYARWQRGVDEFEMAARSDRADRLDPDAEAVQRRTTELAAEIDGYVRELAQLGVECTGFAEGSVIFPTEIDGRRGVLSWRLGESAVEHWLDRGGSPVRRHPLTAIAGDRPLPPGDSDGSRA